jgi:anti-sigma B factor antagonist
VPGWRCIFPACGARRPAGGSLKVIAVALRISASAGADGPVVVLSGEADLTTTELLRETLATQLGTGARLVTVDASELSFVDSASLRVLVLAARALHARHGTLVFACPQPVVARLLEITGADRLLDVQESAGLAGSVNDGPTGRTDPAWADPDGYDPSC